jgi:ammonia channel protein AmtB
LTASALVLMMTLPGLALFYGGLVRTKNFLSVLIQCGAIAAITSLLWIVIGYSLAFSASEGTVIGNLQNLMFSNMFAMRDGQTIGELVFGLFQMTFAIITPALIVGAWAERARFGWVVAFSALWSPAGLHPSRALGMGQRISCQSGCDRFCRRHCGAHHRWYFCAGRRLDARQAYGFSAHLDAAA